MTKGLNEMTDRLTIFELLLFLLAWNDQPAERTQAAWLAGHPVEVEA